MAFDKKKEIDVELGADVAVAEKVEIIDSYKVEEDESFIAKDDSNHNKWGLKMDTSEMQLVNENDEDQDDLYRE